MIVSEYTELKAQQVRLIKDIETLNGSKYKDYTDSLLEEIKAIERKLKQLKPII